MKAKALLILGLVAGGYSASAQVSANIVGYVNVTVNGLVNGLPKYKIISNPLLATSNKVSDVIKVGATDDLTLFLFSPASGFSAVVVSGGEILEGGDSLIPPGKGFFATSGSAADVKITFVGQVAITEAVAGQNVAAGLDLYASILPKAGRLGRDLEYPAPTGDTDSDTVFQFVNGSTYVSTDQSSGLWLDNDGTGFGPQIAVAEGFWVRHGGGAQVWKQPSASALLQ